SFFFQAEDGIRDSSVTGVQTCALPIYDGRGGDVLQHHRGGSDGGPVAVPYRADHLARGPEMAFFADRGRAGTDRGRGDVAHLPRSEERRVGKAWSTRREGWWCTDRKEE